MSEIEAITKLEQELGLISPSEIFQEKLNSLASVINDLLNNNFQKLIGILYRMDINENKLRRLLEENKNADAGMIIARLMIERESQKILTRKENSKKDRNISDDESW